MRKHYLAIAALVAGLAVAACAVADTVATIARDTVLRVRDAFVNVVLAAFAPFGRAADWTDLKQPAVQLVQACAYALKLAKRERPQVRPDWRMCPST
jgi:hypothetical protein